MGLGHNESHHDGVSRLNKRSTSVSNGLDTLILSERAPFVLFHWVLFQTYF